MEEIKVEYALDVIQMEIAEYINSYKGNDKKEFIQGLKKLVKERDEIYDYNLETINKVINTYK